MPVTLPTKPTPPNLSAATSKILLYGPPGIGKTTLAVGMDPEHTLLLEVEPGAGAIDGFKMPVNSWEEFRAIGAELAKGEHAFKTVVVDTTDELFRYCQEHMTARLKIQHPSDLEYGKGWSQLSDEFRLRVGRLAGLGLGVVFISHAKDEEVKQRVGSITKSVPTLSGQAGKFLTGFVDAILFATWGGENGNERILRTQPSENWDAKQRVPVGGKPLPDPIKLGNDPKTMGRKVRAALDASLGATT